MYVCTYVCLYITSTQCDNDPRSLDFGGHNYLKKDDGTEPKGPGTEFHCVHHAVKTAKEQDASFALLRGLILG
jgi:hypothetical protein